MLLMLNRLINITLNFWCQSSCVNGITIKFTLSAYLLKSNCLVDQANDIKKQFPIPDFLQSCTKTLNYRKRNFSTHLPQLWTRRVYYCLFVVSVQDLKNTL